MVPSARTTESTSVGSTPSTTGMPRVSTGGHTFAQVPSQLDLAGCLVSLSNRYSTWPSLSVTTEPIFGMVFLISDAGPLTTGAPGACAGAAAVGVGASAGSGPSLATLFDRGLCAPAFPAQPATASATAIPPTASMARTVRLPRFTSPPAFHRLVLLPGIRAAPGFVSEIAV